MSLIFESPILHFDKVEWSRGKSKNISPRMKQLDSSGKDTNLTVGSRRKMDIKQNNETKEPKGIIALARRRGIHKRTHSDFPMQKTPIVRENNRNRSPLVKKTNPERENNIDNSNRSKRLSVHKRVPSINFERQFKNNKRQSITGIEALPPGATVTSPSIEDEQKTPKKSHSTVKVSSRRRVSLTLDTDKSKTPLPKLRKSPRGTNMSSVRQFIANFPENSPHTPQNSSLSSFSPSGSPSLKKQSPRTRFNQERTFVFRRLQMTASQQFGFEHSFSPPPPDAKLGDYPKPERGLHQDVIRSAKKRSNVEENLPSKKEPSIYLGITSNHPVTSPETPISPCTLHTPIHIEPLSMESIKKNFNNELEEQEKLKEEYDKQKSREARINVLVYVPNVKEVGTGTLGIHVNLPNSSTGKLMIKRALTLYREKTGVDPLFDDPRAFMLYKAEDDGTVDTDYPSITKENPLPDLLQITSKFILVVDQNFKKLKTITPDIPQYLRKNITDILVQVILPDCKDSHCNVVPIAPDVLNRDLLLTICQRFHLDPKLHDMQLIRENNVRFTIPPHMIYKTVRFLDVQKVELFHKYRSNTMVKNISTKTYSETPSSPQPENKIVGENFIPLESVAYHEYSVIKINKYNMRQERTLGIDSLNLYNIISKKRPDKVFKFFKKTRPSILPYSLSTLMKVIYDPSTHPKQFTTLFENEKMLWETATEVEAAKIVSTLNYLMSLHKTNSFLPAKGIITPNI